MIEICIHLPLDAGDDEAVRRFIADFHKAKAQAADRADAAARILECDEAMAEWSKRNAPGTPITRAASYGGEIVPAEREICGFGAAGDPRRPVVMRGAKGALAIKYAKSPHSGCPNGWCERVIYRYLRRIKYTCLDFEAHNSFMFSITDRLRNKYSITSRIEPTLDECIEWCESEAERDRLRLAFAKYVYETTHLASPTTIKRREYRRALIPYSAIEAARATLTPGGPDAGMTDDDAIETLAKLFHEQGAARLDPPDLTPWADISTHRRDRWLGTAHWFARQAADIGLTPTDLAGLADGTRGVVDVGASPGAKEGDDA